MRVRFCMNAGPKNNKVWADKKGRGSECAGATWIKYKETPLIMHLTKTHGTFDGQAAFPEREFSDIENHIVPIFDFMMNLINFLVNSNVLYSVKLYDGVLKSKDYF